MTPSVHEDDAHEVVVFEPHDDQLGALVNLHRKRALHRVDDRRRQAHATDGHVVLWLPRHRCGQRRGFDLQPTKVSGRQFRRACIREQNGVRRQCTLRSLRAPERPPGAPVSRQVGAGRSLPRAFSRGLEQRKRAEHNHDDAMSHRTSQPVDSTPGFRGRCRRRV